MFEEAIVFVESVKAAKQLGTILHEKYGMENVAVLVGKGSMSMEQQALALLQFKDTAKILICTSVGEEGLDVPTADIEIWMEPPSNPKNGYRDLVEFCGSPAIKSTRRRTPSLRWELTKGGSCSA